MKDFSIKLLFKKTFKLKNEETSILSKYQINKKEQLILNFKNIVFATFVIFLLNAVNNFFSNFSYSLIVTNVCCIFFAMFWVTVSKKNFNAARISYMLLCCISMCALCYIEGFVSGNYLFLFLFTIASSFIFDYKETTLLISALLLIVLSVVFIFSFTPYHSFLQPLTAKVEDVYFTYNIIATALVTCIMSFILLWQNYNNAKKMAGKQKFLNSIFNTSLDAVFVINTSTNIIENCNNHFNEIFNFDSSATFNKSANDLFVKNEAFKDFEKSLVGKSVSWKGELLCVSSSGNIFPGFVSVVSFSLENLEFKKVNILDITEFKKAQSDLIIAKENAEKAMKAKSKFLSNMSHELRTPLNGIIGTANLLLDEASMPEQQEHFELLKYSSEQMLNLVNDVLDFSKIEAEMMRIEKNTFNANELFGKVNSLFSSQFKAKNVELIMNIDKTIDRLLIGDETKIGQVVNNLISNALKFTEKGNVTVTAKLNKNDSHHASLFVSVKDTGIGITKKQQKLIFNSFTQADDSTTRKFGGTGLGLSICKSIVEMLKGELKVKSSETGGSEFYFEIKLDLQLDNKKFVNEKLLKTLQSLENINVLIAEDNNINMLIARKFLKKWCIASTEAINGKEAIRKFDKTKHNVLLIDLEMPEMDGYETIAEIRKTNKDIPVIAFTAAVYDNIKTDLLSHGFTDYIQKPFRPEDLHKKIAQFMPAVAG